MAKQTYEKKEIINICGVLDKFDSEHYIVHVETKENTFDVDFEDILEKCLGREISFKQETDIE